MQVDLTAVDTEEFNVSPRGEFVLVTPKKSKHVWSESELPLRSLLCQPDGTVVSAGWPRFANYGENPIHDAEFRAAMTRNAVSFSEKLDGTLIILSAGDMAPRFRTRGNDTLGVFEEPVMALIHEHYPGLLRWYSTDAFLGDHLRRKASILFEYVAPTNQIVVKYDVPRLYLLGVVYHDDVKPVWDSATLAAISVATGVPCAPRISFIGDSVTDLLESIRSWKGKEGVVAGFVGSLDGIECTPRMLKIKASEYIRLHSLKFRLSGKVAKLAFLLGIQKPDDVAPALGALGIDHEAQQFIMPEMVRYLLEYETTSRLWADFKELVQADLSRDRPAIFADDPKGHRRFFVTVVKNYLENHWLPPCFFTAAMRIYDGNFVDAAIVVYASEVLHESPITVRQWLANPSVAVTDMLQAQVPEDE